MTQFKAYKTFLCEMSIFINYMFNFHLYLFSLYDTILEKLVVGVTCICKILLNIGIIEKIGISLIFSEKKIFQIKQFTKFIKEFTPQKSRIKNLYHKKQH